MDDTLEAGACLPVLEVKASLRGWWKVQEFIVKNVVIYAEQHTYTVSLVL